MTEVQTAACLIAQVSDCGKALARKTVVPMAFSPNSQLAQPASLH